MLAAFILQKLIVYLYDITKATINDSLLEKLVCVAGALYSCVIKANVIKCAE
jgi:hypothetical protein